MASEPADTEKLVRNQSNEESRRFWKGVAAAAATAPKLESSEDGVPPSPAESLLELTPIEREEHDVPSTGWPQFTPGELIRVRGIWFEVAGTGGGMLHLRPRGPSSALLRRLARAKQRRR